MQRCHINASLIIILCCAMCWLYNTQRLVTLFRSNIRLVNHLTGRSVADELEELGIIQLAFSGVADSRKRKSIYTIPQETLDWMKRMETKYKQDMDRIVNICKPYTRKSDAEQDYTNFQEVMWVDEPHRLTWCQVAKVSTLNLIIHQFCDILLLKLECYNS